MPAAFFSFSAIGKPVAQPRGRATRRGAHAGIYDPGTADGWKSIVRAASRPAKPPSALSGALTLTLAFRFCRPTGHTTPTGKLRKSAPLAHVSKPDFDNLAKAVCDALTHEGWWHDDTQIDTAYVTKAWTDNPQLQGVTVTIRATAPDVMK